MLEKKQKQVQPLLMHILKIKLNMTSTRTNAVLGGFLDLIIAAKCQLGRTIIGAADADKKLFKLDIKYP